MNVLFSQNAGPAPSPLGQMPPNDGMPGGPMPPGFFPVSTLLVYLNTLKDTSIFYNMEYYFSN
jgi:hypothetical protein